MFMQTWADGKNAVCVLNWHFSMQASFTVTEAEAASAPGAAPEILLAWGGGTAKW